MKDTDGDGISDGEEDLNLDGSYDKGETDPTDPVLGVTSNPVILYPENNAVVYNRRPPIRGTAQKNLILEILDNGEKIGETSVDSQGNYILKPQKDLELGEHFLQARVKSAHPNLVLTSSGTTFTIMPFTSPLSSSPRNYPNPFNPDSGTTVIYYELNADTNISLRIYNLCGEEIFSRDYDAGTQGGIQGLNQIVWNGRDDFEQSCASGIYLGAIISGGKILDRFKIAILR